ncbi:MAG: hypothetical protein EBU57_13470, partial [Alphaproteobacteria bacterium]|nr:hypothetical protein [Alphaproteobacteria bacterium]
MTKRPSAPKCGAGSPTPCPTICAAGRRALPSTAPCGGTAISAQGINHVGPILMAFGTDAQKNRHLPPILTGDETWCQGYSEPGAGSDLASLRTRADIDGDDFVINGSKIWTTWAHHSDWIFALVRSDPDAPRKQAGISFVLIDLKTPGIDIRPIKTIAGDEEFAEVFFDDVRVPMENLVGDLHDVSPAMAREF